MPAKFRIRTWMRRNLPYVISDRIDKGTSDCGKHDWYLSEPGVYHCYHCVVGVKQGGRAPMPDLKRDADT